MPEARLGKNFITPPPALAERFWDILSALGIVNLSILERV
jgi:hypothetical protein